ncbi:MAG TPA: M3 family oligoendopeptidase [Bellilinea sp.]|nr:M3 family oligoendopeptidase [Bellilinea sp.]
MDKKAKVYQQGPWSLKDLYPGPKSKEYQEAFAQAETLVAALEKQRKHLTPQITSKKLNEILGQMEVIHDHLSRMYAFAGLSYAANTQDQTALGMVARMDQFYSELQNRLLFFELWWKDLDDKNAARLLKDTGDITYWLEALRSFKPHTLSESEEKIVNIKNVTGRSALDTLYSSITNRYTFELRVNGEKRKMTRGELMSLVRLPDPKIRAQAYQELYRVFGNDAAILGQIYQTVVRDWYNENVGMRSYKTPIATRNLYNQLPDAVVETLLKVAKKNAVVFQHYFKLKAKWLGMKKLRRYDIYAPVVKSDKTYTFAESADLVLRAFGGFTPKMAELAQKVLDAEHVDSEVRHGKQGGAFCWGATPKLTPWVLLNYNGRADDVATMAHELGHAIHGLLASDHSIFTTHSNLPLAETASTFGEMTLVDLLLKTEKDESVRRDLLFRQVDDSYATIMRQVFFALFEKEAHDLIQKGASVDELNAAYLKNLEAQFGDSIQINDEFKHEWVSIPHIFSTPFYVYAYAFGQLLVLSLYKRYKAEGEKFIPQYLALLSAGGSKAPVELLKEAGVDVSKEAFWQGGFDVLDDMVKQLEALPIVRAK